MKNFGKAVVKSRFVILVVAVLLLIPSVWGYRHTRVNYDLLTYLPKTIETMKGQDILVDEFGTGAVSMLVIDDKSTKDIIALKQEILKVDHVKNVIWYDSIADASVPMSILPDKILKIFVRGDSTLMAITYDTSTSDDKTMDAIENIRKLLDSNCYLQGMSSVVTDTRDLAEQEEPIYVGLAVLLASIVLALTMDTFLAPVFFLLSIGMAILYNLGSNYFIGQVSYITKALAAVLQLGVTMDYSIFLWNSFKEHEEMYPNDKKRAMAEAINATLQSVVGSSVTTIAGFAALCFMSFRFGLDIGVCMMKGVALGVISCVTILPSMILMFEKAIEKTRHKPLLPRFKKLPGFVEKHYKGLLIAFCIIWIPAIFGYTHTSVYYDMIQTLPKNLPSIVANEKLKDTFNMSNTLMVLVDKQMSQKEISDMCTEIKDVKGIKDVVGTDYLLGGGVPDEMIPDDLTDELESKKWKLVIATSEYDTATDEINNQIDTIDKIIDKYSSTSMLIGDAPCTKDLITISNHDFNVVNWVSIGIIFAIILFLFQSISLPFILVLIIEFAIFINMAIPYYTNVSLPFIASIVIGTIQLGSTVDYAVLMTSRYQAERSAGKGKKESIRIAHSTSITSIVVSALTFFASTFGVAIYSSITMISSLCVLMARGALISMVTVITMLPAAMYLLDPIIVHTSRGFLPKKDTAKAGDKSAADSQKKDDTADASARS